MLLIAKQVTDGSTIEIVYSYNEVIKRIRFFDFCKESPRYANRTCPVQPGRS